MIAAVGIECLANETGAYRHTELRTPNHLSGRVNEAAFIGGVSYVEAGHSSGQHPPVRRHLTASNIRNRDDDYSVYGQEQPFQWKAKEIG